MDSANGNLLDEFWSLSRRDRQAILSKLPIEIQSQLQRKNKLDGFVDRQEASIKQIESNEFAPWILGCLHTEQRDNFPALRNDFEMAKHARECLKEILGLTDEEARNEDTEAVAESQNQQSPSLMNKTVGFLSRKIMSL